MTAFLRHGLTAMTSQVSRFRQHLESQHEAFRKLALQLMRALEAMQVVEGTFTERCVSEVSELRLNHYAAVIRQELDVRDARRIWPHTDTGLFSFVSQGNGRGLQDD
jgi:isopenicillin N synthase-like dioxygenase